MQYVLGTSSGYSAFLLNCMATIRSKPIIQRSPRGKGVGDFLCVLEEMGKDKFDDISLLLITEVYTCLAPSENPFAVQRTLWHDFHTLRNSESVKNTWKFFISSLHPPMCECELTIQLLLDTML